MKGYSKEVEERLQKQERKQRAANGECRSKMFSFRLDYDNIGFLNLQRNKGGLINELLRAECARRKALAEKERSTE